jgi:hypothetical protein
LAAALEAADLAIWGAKGLAVLNLLQTSFPSMEPERVYAKFASLIEELAQALYEQYPSMPRGLRFVVEVGKAEVVHAHLDLPKLVKEATLRRLALHVGFARAEIQAPRFPTLHAFYRLKVPLLGLRLGVEGRVVLRRYHNRLNGGRLVTKMPKSRALKASDPLGKRRQDLAWRAAHWIAGQDPAEWLPIDIISKLGPVASLDSVLRPRWHRD